MRVTVLIENTSLGELPHEHGLSLHLDYNGHSVLLDAGSSGLFAENAAALGIDLAGVEAAVLSHGHFDHGDGLERFFALNPTVPVCVRADALSPQYVQVGQVKKFIGLRPTMVAEEGRRFQPVEGCYPLLPGLFLVPDSVPHEQSLVAETAKGLVVFNSCCHAGADHIVAGVLEQFPGQSVYALVGGFHLMGATGTRSLGVPEEQVRALACRLTDDLGVARIYTGHCTGAPAFALLQETRPQHIHPLSTGMILEF